MYTPPNPFDHGNRYVGNHVTDDIHEQEIFQAALNAEKREMRLGSKNCKNIECLKSLSYIATMLAEKIERSHTLIPNPHKMNIEISKIHRRIEDIESEFFEYQFNS